MLLRLLKEIQQPCILTINAPELEPIKFVEELRALSGTNLHVTINRARTGFAANHNAAFALASQQFGAWVPGDVFCVLNPDVCWQVEPFAALLEALSIPGAGIAYPRIVDSRGKLQDYARKLATPWSIFKRQVLGQRSSCSTPDWVCGALLVFRADVFAEPKGFDEGYFLYAEDIDICLRAQIGGYRLVEAKAEVIHDSQRRTRINADHFYWHLRSLLRLWTSRTYWQYWWCKRLGRLPAS